uniref:Uncharacterized protein n=1 Tax=Knipowitschia caucasica TaxID=637954 RepID=A0AAV2IS86_KNICA
MVPEAADVPVSWFQWLQMSQSHGSSGCRCPSLMVPVSVKPTHRLIIPVRGFVPSRGARRSPPSHAETGNGDREEHNSGSGDLLKLEFQTTADGSRQVHDFQVLGSTPLQSGDDI